MLTIYLTFGEISESLTNNFFLSEREFHSCASEMERIVRATIIGYSGLLALNYMEKRTTNRRWWVRELNLSRDADSWFAKNFDDMKSKDPEHFFTATRMN